MTAADLLAAPFATLSHLIRAHATERGDKVALIDEGAQLTYAELDRTMDRIAAGLVRDGVVPGGAVAMVAANSATLAAVFLGALRAGAVPAPIAPSATPGSVAAMVADSGSPLAFVDDAVEGLPVTAIRLDALTTWMPETAPASDVPRAPGDPFNIIYSSGTTGTPKGIVQSHGMRWQHIHRNAAAGFGDAVTLVATPLYSNTTLVSFLPTLGWGGTAVLMGRFDARRYLDLAERTRATHTMLVPVQYARIMADPAFDRFDLSSFRLKTCTSAPFAAALKADVVARWPGLLVEYYGMTEGGASFALNCTAHPDKLATVGQLLPGHEARLIDAEGREVATGEVGEVVGRSGAMMTGYHNRPGASRDAEWNDGQGRRFIRHGDLGRFDPDGFLALVGRAKDLIISGGFNIYPSDLEAVLAAHPDVADCAVVGMPSETWGESPVAVYVSRRADADPLAIMAWANERLGKTQRLVGIHAIAELPHSAIGKVLKRELRERLERA